MEAVLGQPVHVKPPTSIIHHRAATDAVPPPVLLLALRQCPLRYLSLQGGTDEQRMEAVLGQPVHVKRAPGIIHHRAATDAVPPPVFLFAGRDGRAADGGCARPTCSREAPHRYYTSQGGH